MITERTNYLKIEDTSSEMGIEVTKQESGVFIEAYECYLDQVDIDSLIEFLKKPYIDPKQLNLF